MTDRTVNVNTPFGVVRIMGSEKMVWQIKLPDPLLPETADTLPSDLGLTGRTVEAVRGYFTGIPIPAQLANELVDSLPHRLPDGMSISLFYRQIWKALITVGWGETVSYRLLAVMSGAPNAARAIGTAMARNPLPIIVPCHRVIRSDGGLGGYGGGLDMKRGLLKLEGVPF